MAMEIETLRNRKEELKSELETEIQKEQSLGNEIKILEEKLAIRDLEQKLDERRESVKKLESIKTTLESQYGQPQASIPAEEDKKKSEQENGLSTGLIVQEEPVSSPAPVEPTEQSEKKKKHSFFS